MIDTDKETIAIKKGFPPKLLPTNEHTLNQTLTELGFRNKDSLILEIDPSKVVLEVEEEKVPLDDLKIEINDSYWMYRRIIQANDSCLFNSIGLALKGSLAFSKELRNIVSAKILTN